MSEDRLFEQRNLGSRANDLLHNDAYQKAILDVKEGIVAVWKTCKDAQERDRAWQAFNMVEQISQAIVSTYSSGRLANAELEEAIKKQERRKIFGIV